MHINHVRLIFGLEIKPRLQVMGCHWGKPNDTYFQLANVFLAFCYLVPDTVKGIIVLRFLLGIAGFFFIMWGGTVLCSPDTVAWNIIFMCLNFGHVTYLLWKMRPIRFDEGQELCYENVFELLGVERWQYKAIAPLGMTTELPKGSFYAKEDVSDGTNISIVLSGSCQVTRRGKVVGRLKPFEFLDSPEWIASTKFGSGSTVTFEVSIVSDGCTILSWNRNALLRVLCRNPFLKNIFDTIIGQDVTRKISRQYKSMSDAFQQSNRERPARKSVSHVVFPTVTESLQVPTISKSPPETSTIFDSRIPLKNGNEKDPILVDYAVSTTRSDMNNHKLQPPTNLVASQAVTNIQEENKNRDEMGRRRITILLPAFLDVQISIAERVGTTD